VTPVEKVLCVVNMFVSGRLILPPPPRFRREARPSFDKMRLRLAVILLVGVRYHGYPTSAQDAVHAARVPRRAAPTR